MGANPVRQEPGDALGAKTADTPPTEGADGMLMGRPKAAGTGLVGGRGGGKARVGPRAPISVALCGGTANGGAGACPGRPKGEEGCRGAGSRGARAPGRPRGRPGSALLQGPSPGGAQAVVLEGEGGAAAGGGGGRGRGGGVRVRGIAGRRCVEERRAADSSEFWVTPKEAGCCAFVLTRRFVFKVTRQMRPHSSMCF